MLPRQLISWPNNRRGLDLTLLMRALALRLACVAATGADVSYSVRTFTTNHGLPQNTVHAVQQTRDGYLWIATRFGLACFDGARFVTFTLANTPALPGVHCTALAGGSEGRRSRERDRPAGFERSAAAAAPAARRAVAVRQ